MIGVLKGTTNAGEARDLHARTGITSARARRCPADKPDADRIYNGAYDNASGVAGVLEIAKAFAKAPQKPARSIYFAFVTAEESGLLGSSFLAANPPMPMDKVAANINIDGVNYLGPTTDMVQLGSDRSTLGPMVEAILKERGRTLGRRSASGARLLLPLGSLPVREGRRAGDVAERADSSSPARTPRS